MEVLVRICKALECGIGDVVNMCADSRIVENSN
ncbi:hypothetical protein [Chryseobacterium sp.]